MAMKIKLWYKSPTPKNVIQPFTSGSLGTLMLPSLLRPRKCFQTKGKQETHPPSPNLLL